MFEPRKIYTVNTFTDFKQDDFYKSELIYRCVNIRTPGYYHRLRDAKRCVLENWGDIWETIYTYACIEEVEPGLYPTTEHKWWYKWNNEKQTYEKIKLSDLVFSVSKGEIYTSFTIG